MPYASPYVYLRAIGDFHVNNSPVDDWSVGFKFPLGLAPTGATLQAFLETVSVPMSAFHSNSDIQAGSAARLMALTAAYLDNDGKYVGGGSQQTTERPYPAPIVGASTTRAPFTQALVLSLRTTVSRGPGSNGRLYWPATGLVMGDTGQITTAVALAVAGRAKTLLDQLNAAAAATFTQAARVSVMSKVGDGLSAPVTSVRIGTKVDRQERRENGFDEQYAGVALASTAALVTAMASQTIGEG